MKLSYWDLDYIHERMKTYDIKFQEIYNEIFDHISTAIEDKINTGDTRDLKIIFQDVIDMHFGGYYAVEKVSLSYESAYKKKVNKLIWANFRYYINFKSFLFTIALIWLSFSFSSDKTAKLIWIVPLIITTFYPIFHSFIKLKSLKPAKGKKSLIYSQILFQCYLPMVVFNLVIYIPPLLHYAVNDENYRMFNHISLPIMALWVAIAVIYDLSCMRLCNQALEQFVNVNPNTL